MGRSRWSQASGVATSISGANSLEMIRIRHIMEHFYQQNGPCNAILYTGILSFYHYDRRVFSQVFTMLAVIVAEALSR